MVKKTNILKQYFNSSIKQLQHMFVFTLCDVTNVDTLFWLHSSNIEKCVINRSITSDCEPHSKQKPG